MASRDKQTKELVDLLLEVPSDASRYYSNFHQNTSESPAYTTATAVDQGNNEYNRFMENQEYMFSDNTGSGVVGSQLDNRDREWAEQGRFMKLAGNNTHGLNPMAMHYLATPSEGYNQDEANFVQNFAVQQQPFLPYPYLANYQQPFTSHLYSQFAANMYSFGQFADAHHQPYVGPDGQPYYAVQASDNYQVEALDHSMMYQSVDTALEGLSLDDQPTHKQLTQPQPLPLPHPQQQQHPHPQQQQQQPQPKFQSQPQAQQVQIQQPQPVVQQPQRQQQQPVAQHQHQQRQAPVPQVVQQQQQPPPKPKPEGPRSWADVLSAPAPSSTTSKPAPATAKKPSFQPSTAPAPSKPKSEVIAKTEDSRKAQQKPNTSASPHGRLNRPDLDCNPHYARFFVIKSYSEDDIHKAIKYNTWASTDSGNRRLDAAYKESATHGPIYLFFSVNASGQFCGMAQMTSSLDYSKKCEYWEQDKWNGQFTVNWIFIKDIPNSVFRHIKLANNDGKPVTNSRDTQEVLLEQGKEMLRIFSTFVSKTSIMDDFTFYDKRQEIMKEKKTLGDDKTPEDDSSVKSDELPLATGENRKKNFAKPAYSSATTTSTTTTTATTTTNRLPTQQHARGTSSPSSSSPPLSSSGTGSGESNANTNVVAGNSSGQSKNTNNHNNNSNANGKANARGGSGGKGKR